MEPDCSALAKTIKEENQASGSHAGLCNAAFCGFLTWLGEQPSATKRISFSLDGDMMAAWGFSKPRFLELKLLFQAKCTSPSSPAPVRGRDCVYLSKELLLRNPALACFLAQQQHGSAEKPARAVTRLHSADCVRKPVCGQTKAAPPPFRMCRRPRPRP